MSTRTVVQALGTVMVVAALAWQCAAGHLPAELGPAALSDRLVPRANDRPQTAVVGVRF